MMSEATTFEVEANGIRFAGFEMGEGPLLLCLHGFPDDARTWRHQMPAFAKAGYRVVAPYIRGYAPTSASPGGHYQTAALGRDVVGLIDALSPKAPAVVFGHDWGALAAYAGALLAPKRISRLVTAAVPYGPRLQTAFLTNYAQQKRSWYMFFFQTFMAEPAVASAPRVGLALRTAIVLCLVGVVGLGLWPRPLHDAARAAGDSLAGALSSTTPAPIPTPSPGGTSP